MKKIIIFVLLFGHIVFCQTPKIVNHPFPGKLIRDSSKNYIILHYDSASNHAVTFETLTKQGNAYHYLIEKDGTIYNMIDPKYQGRHAGLSFLAERFHVNKFTIGICLVNSGKAIYTDAQYLSLSWLIKTLEQRYHDIDSTRIKGHSDVAVPRGRKRDPGPFFDWRRMFNMIKKPDSTLSVIQIKQMRQLWSIFDRSTAFGCSGRRTSFDQELCKTNWQNYNSYINSIYGWDFGPLNKDSV